MNNPPPDWDPLAELDLPEYEPPDDTLLNEVFADDFDYLPQDDPFSPFAVTEADAGLAGLEAPSANVEDEWQWHDAAIIALERSGEAGSGAEYSVGVVDLYADANTGDVGGRYLELAAFEESAAAADYYHEVQCEVHEQRVLPFDLSAFAEDKVRERNDAVQEWDEVSPAAFAAYEAARSLDEGEPDMAVEAPGFRALHGIGITADGFYPDTDPPPFVDPETGTAYWIGVFQPDKDDPSNCVTSILSLGRNPDTGEVEAQLAPCVPGDWDKAYGSAEHLLGMVEKGGIERAFDAAESMALASEQRDLWQGERGIPLENDAAHDLADYTRAQWDLDL